MNLFQNSGTYCLLLMLSIAHHAFSLHRICTIPEKVTISQQMRTFYHRTKLKHNPAYQDMLDARLIRAVKDHNFPDVQMFLRAGASPNVHDCFGQTPLILAMYLRNTACDPFDEEKLLRKKNEYLAIIKYLLSIPIVVTDVSPANIILNTEPKETLLMSVILHDDTIGAQLLQKIEDCIYAT